MCADQTFLTCGCQGKPGLLECVSKYSCATVYVMRLADMVARACAHEDMHACARARTHVHTLALHRVVKSAYNGQEQDIEGVISQGKVWVVQSRPQITP